MGAFADFQKSVYAALRSTPALTSIVSDRIFDDVPHGKEPSAPTFPFVTIGEQNMAEESASDTDMARFRMTVHAWSRGAGRLQCLEMIDAIRSALHWQRGYLTASGKVVDMMYVSHETLRDPDGETYHGVISFAGLYELYG